MKLRYICLLGLITLIGADDLPANVRVVKTVSSSISSEPAGAFETAHKITENREFQTAHKITNERPIIKLLDDDDAAASSAASSADLDLMQQQNPQNLLSTKERPELNPVLSALINEDVMKSIESKRAVEESVTVAPINTLTTSEQPVKMADDDVIVANVGLVDQSINLEEAGSETNQKSRIQIKKGPNGQDYEYEYVYYYYDEDEKNEKGQGGQTKQKVAASEQSSAARESSTRGKSRYTNIERSTTSTPDNEIGGARGRGRANAAAADVEEGRLPQNTRFPPRSRGGDVTPAPEAVDEKPAAGGRRTGVKRPSLDLVDSDSFNTDEKQVKSNRNIENELSKKSTDGEEGEARAVEDAADADSVPQTTNPADSDVENTTPLMEKAALDLYAIIANENFNMDATTGDSVDATTTDVPTTSADELTTIVEEEPTTTTTTTTTPEPTTTTTTTTTTTPAPGRRGGVGGGSRNRFRLKNGSATTTTTTEAPAETGKSGGKTKGRFGGRPSFGSGRTPRPSKEHKEEVKEEVQKEESKPSSLRGRTRNRFNLRGASTTEKSADENTIDSKPVSTTARSRPARPALSLRGRGRPAASTSTPASTSEGESDASSSSDGGDKPTQATASLPRPSRFNLGRPGGAAAGANRLLPRGRVNPLKPAAAAKDAAPAEEKTDDETVAAATPATDGEASSTDGDKGAAQEPAPTPAAGSGLNRLKNRPKIQVTQKTAKAPAPVIVRKPNPLIGRRRIGASSSTTETPAGDDESAAGEGAGDDENVAGDENDPKDEAASDAAPQIVEAASEQPARGLGLLANRRRLAIRKPGTLN